MGFPWDDAEILAEAWRAARKRRRGLKHDAVRFVAYSYPKVGVQFLAEDTEVSLLELVTWAEVPPASAQERFTPRRRGRGDTHSAPGCASRAKH